MLLVLTAFICSAAIIFAGIPAALNNANRIHIENGRKPDAGIAFMPELITMTALWWGVGAGLRHFFGLPTALVVVPGVSGILFLWQILLSLKSNREHAKFLRKHKVETSPAKQTREP